MREVGLGGNQVIRIAWNGALLRIGQFFERLHQHRQPVGFAVAGTPLMSGLNHLHVFRFPRDQPEIGGFVPDRRGNGGR